MHPLSLNDRISFLYLEHGRLAVTRQALAWEDKEGCCFLPVAQLSTVLLGPGTSLTHEAVRRCSDSDVLLLWVGAQGNRLYGAGNPRGKPEHLQKQVLLATATRSRLDVARRVFRCMFGASPPKCYSVDQIRGLEGTRVRARYAELAKERGIIWKGRDVSPGNDRPNQAISLANSLLYGVTEAVVLIMGYSPSIGFLHNNNERGLVFDLADTIKFQWIVPMALDVAKQESDNLWPEIRSAFRKVVEDNKLMKKLAENLEYILDVEPYFV